MSLVRVDKVLSNRGYCTRREAVSLVKQGRVKANGVVVTNAAQKVEEDGLSLDDKALDPAQLYILLNKPVGVTCSHKDSGRLVYELFPERWMQRNPQIATVGRLDKDTSGVILLTDDGALLHKLASPKYHVSKLYEVWAEHELSSSDLEALSSGTMLLEGEDTPIASAQIQTLGENYYLLELWEGRYHQVKRMFEAVGNSVVKLHRRSFAGLTCQDLEPGSYRFLSSTEVAELVNLGRSQAQSSEPQIISQSSQVVESGAKEGVSGH